MARSGPIVALVALALLGGAAALFLRCGKQAAPVAPTVSLAGTWCEAIANAPAASPRGPLPDDPEVAAWVVRIESATDEMLAIDALAKTHSRQHRLGPADAACVKRLWEVVDRRLPAGSRLHALAAYEATSLLDVDGGGVASLEKVAPAKTTAAPTGVAGWLKARTEDGADDRTICASTTKFLAPFPPNVRLRRALLLNFRPCVEDNFSSIDGELDRDELFFRATAEVLPDRFGLELGLFVEGDDAARPAALTSIMWSDVPFPRITLDLGLTGNALRVTRDLTRGRPELVKQILPVVRKQATSSSLPPHRRARWAALLAYLEAGAPDPGDPPEPMLARTIEHGDTGAVRWALGFVPNELEEAAPHPFPITNDPALMAAVVARTSAIAGDEDTVLLLDALSRMPLGTGLSWIARTAATASPSVWHAALEAIKRQLDQLGESPASVPAARAVLAEHLPALRAGLAARVCDRDATLATLALAGDKELGAEVAACLPGRALGDDGVLGSVFRECLAHREIDWRTTVAAIEANGTGGAYGERVAKGCRTGKDE